MNIFCRHKEHWWIQFRPVNQDTHWYYKVCKKCNKVVKKYSIPSEIFKRIFIDAEIPEAGVMATDNIISAFKKLIKEGNVKTNELVGDVKID